MNLSFEGTNYYILFQIGDVYKVSNTLTASLHRSHLAQVYVALTRTEGGRLLIFQSELSDLVAIAPAWKQAIRDRTEVSFPLGTRGRLEALVNKDEGDDGPLTVALKTYGDAYGVGTTMDFYGAEFSALLKAVCLTKALFSTDKIEVVLSSYDDDDDDSGAAKTPLKRQRDGPLTDRPSKMPRRA